MLQNLLYGDGKGLQKLVVIILILTLVSYVRMLKMLLVLAVLHFKLKKELEQ